MVSLSVKCLWKSSLLFYVATIIHFQYFILPSVWIYHNLILHYSFGEHLDCYMFALWAVHIHACISVKYMLKTKITGSQHMQIFNFRKLCLLIPKFVVKIYILTSRAQEIFWFTFLPKRGNVNLNFTNPMHLYLVVSLVLICMSPWVMKLGHYSHIYWPFRFSL